ncbi:MAG: alpha-hydroxy-acid oxidizing protein, partial [Candidatus Binatia bacterium]
ARVAAGFAGWGIPTAAAVAAVRRALGDHATVIASGGIRSGLDVAKCLALGADLAGMALPLFRAQQRGGIAAAREALEVVLQGLRQATLLAGAGRAGELRRQPVVVTGRLKDWLGAL